MAQSRPGSTFEALTLSDETFDNIKIIAKQAAPKRIDTWLRLFVSHVEQAAQVNGHAVEAPVVRQRSNSI